MISGACGIYAISLLDGRTYIGSSENIRVRWNGHRSQLNRGVHHSPYLQHCWDKYGEEAFTFSILEECDIDDLIPREQWWIEDVNPVFNVVPIAGKTTGYTHSEETRAKMSEIQKELAAQNPPRSHSEETRKKISESTQGRIPWNKGIPWSEEAKAKNSAAQKKRPPISEETREKHRVNSTGNKNCVGRVLSEETKKKIGDSKRGNTYSVGIVRSAETREKLSQIRKQWWADKKAAENAAVIATILFMNAAPPVDY